MADYRDDEILVAEYQIDRGIDRVARQIASSRKNIVTDTPVILGVLNGAFMFTSELVRKLHIECYVDFCRVSSYPAGPDLKNQPQITCPPKIDVTGRDVYIVEDIVDTGHTLHHVLNLLKSRNPNRIEACALLDKPLRREVDVKSRWIGFEIPDEFVVGYGIDYAQRDRNLSYIGKVRFTS